MSRIDKYKVNKYKIVKYRYLAIKKKVTSIII